MKRRALALGLALLCALALLAGRSVGAADPIEPFNGKDLSGWKVRGNPKHSQWTVGTAKLDPHNPRKVVVSCGGKELINRTASEDLYTEAKFGDCHVELEVMVPKGSNSGIYLMGVYEIQVLDSFGKKNADVHDMGAIYSKHAPKVNASAAPGVWQKYVIEFRAPKFNAGGKKIANAKVVRCTLNSQLIHENAEINGPTGGQLTGEVPTGPLMLQGDHGPVAFRNITIQPR